MSKKHPIIVIFMTIFLDMLGYGIIIPVIPILLADPTSPYFILPSMFTLEEGYIILGIVLGFQPLMQFFAAPILGQLSDRFGRKPILVISLIGTLISYVAFAISILDQNLWLLFASRGLNGITGGTISVAHAATADISDAKTRTKNFGLMGAAFGIGFIIGPFIGGVLSNPEYVSWFEATTPFWFAVILSIINIASLIFNFSETNKNIRDKLRLTWFQSVSHIERAFGLKELRPLFATNFFYYAGFSFLTTFFSIFLIQRFDFDQGDIGLFFAYIGLWLAFTQIVIVRYITKNIPERIMLSFTTFLAGIFALVSIPITSLNLLYIIIPAFAIFNGLTIVNMVSLVSKEAPANMRGEILGINASVQAVAQSIPPILSGFIAAIMTPLSPLYISGSMMILAGIVFVSFYLNFMSGRKKMA